MGIRIIIFIFVATLLLLGLHYLLFLTYIQFFPLLWSFSRTHVFIALLALSLSYLLAMLISHRWENLFTRVFYFLAAFWLGVMIELLMVGVVALILMDGAQVLFSSLSSEVFGIAALLVALSLSGYGVFSALNPRVRSLVVSIAGLPDHWRGKRIVHISDIHLGPIHHIGFLRKIVALINGLDSACVFITGDLFDGADHNLSDAVAPLNDIQAHQGVYFITGNHETYLGVEKAYAALSKTTVRVLKDEVIDLDGIALIGISYPGAMETKDVPAVLKKLSPSFAGKPNILLFHAPVSVDEIKHLGVTLELCGHTHQGQLFPFGSIANAVYKGYAYGLHSYKDFSIYTSCGVGTWGPPMRIGSRSEVVVIELR